jgi:hypothetical protein
MPYKKPATRVAMSDSCDCVKRVWRLQASCNAGNSRECIIVIAVGGFVSILVVSILVGSIVSVISIIDVFGYLNSFIFIDIVNVICCVNINIICVITIIRFINIVFFICIIAVFSRFIINLVSNINVIVCVVDSIHSRQCAWLGEVHFHTGQSATLFHTCSTG